MRTTPSGRARSGFRGMVFLAILTGGLGAFLLAQDASKDKASDPWADLEKTVRTEEKQVERTERFVPPSLYKVPRSAALPPAKADVRPSPYVLNVNLFWYGAFLAGIGLWCWLWGWVGADAYAAGANYRLWNTLFAVLGLGGIAMSALVNAAFAVVLIPVSIAASIFYVQDRNRLVPASQRIFTQESIAEGLRPLIARFGLAQKLGMASEIEARKELELTLVKKDGTTVHAIANTKRALSDALYAATEIIERAINSRVTDIHFEPKGTELRIRYRIDGMLHSIPPYPMDTGRQIINSLKVLADMDIAEKRRSQDGSLSAVTGGKRIEIRAATNVSVHGETMTLRLLDPEGGLFRDGMGGLGFDPDMLQKLRDVIDRPNGMLLVSGPTGSGKTTSLYAALSEIDSSTRNVLTIEDPVEYQLPNITQTPINPMAGITFPSSLRAILRQAPDVIMVGEIRDAETAQIALQASNTGHLVFSTVHASDAITTVYRLLDLGVEPSLMHSALTAVLAQRLVRMLCPSCKEPYQPPPDLLAKMKIPPEKAGTWYNAKGCEECAGIGFSGRVGIFELLVINDDLRELMVRNPSLVALKTAARKSGFRTLRQDGMRKVMQGVTSLREVQRVTK